MIKQWSWNRELEFFALLVMLDLFVLGLHLLLGDHPQLGSLVHLDKEGNLPTWYSSLKFTLAAVAALACYFLERAARIDSVPDSSLPPIRPRLSPIPWLLVALLMLGLSADETAQIHETTVHWFMESPAGDNLRQAFEVVRAGGVLLWGVLLSPLLVVIGGWLLRFYWQRFRGHLWLFGGGFLAVGLLGLALALETREAGLVGVGGHLTAASLRNYQWLTGVEEMAELLAASLITGVHVAYAWTLWSGRSGIRGDEGLINESRNR
ncbi:MAG: hypothetical protein HQL52_15985 [Magnetococcales bacterium]|nr:hypothetical protein [Magnetococcales bacterium]